MNKGSQLGRTMIEMLAVMSVLGMFTASVYTLIGSMTDKYKSSIILTQVRDIRKAISHRYAALGVYTGLTSDILAKERLLSSNMLHNGKIYHAQKCSLKLLNANNVRFGYRWNKEKKCMEIDRDEAAVVNQVFEWYVFNGYGI